MPPSAPKAEPRDHLRLECLDALRGLAAVVVFFQHIVSMFPIPETDLLSKTIFRVVSTSGSAAVDLFFVLSGFVLTLPYVGARAKHMDYTDFTIRRVMRLYPAYWVAVVVAIVARLTLNDPIHAFALTEWTANYWTIPLTTNAILQTGSMVIPFDSRIVNTVFWSLLVEMQISLLLPFFIVALAIASGATSALLILASTIIIALVIAPDSALLFLPLFVLGVVLAKHQGGIVEKLANLSGVMLIALALLSLVLIEARLYAWRYPGLPSDFLSGAGAGLLIVLILARWRQSRLLVNPATHLLGTASYSLYLLHIPVIFAVVPSMYAYTGSVLVSAGGALLVSLVLAQIVYRVFEMPGQASGRKLARSAARFVNGR